VTSEKDHDDTEPMFVAVPNRHPAVLDAVNRAKASVPEFRRLLATNRGPGVFHSAKLRFRDPEWSARLGEDRFVNLWLTVTEADKDGFEGSAFELPKEITWLQVGKPVRFTDDDIVDWMVNDKGHLFGGFSLRVTRAALPEERRASFDEHIGVTSYDGADA